jgi:hypothetical protein
MKDYLAYKVPNIYYLALHRVKFVDTALKGGRVW